MAYTFSRSSVAELRNEIAPLLERHWEEIAWTKELSALNVNWPFYEAMESANSIVVVSGRSGQELVGYSVYFCRFHPHYQTIKWAVSDIYWIAPEHRGKSLGMRMFRFIEDELQRNGVLVMHTTGKTAHPAAKRLLLALGHTEIEWGVGKILR